MTITVTTAVSLTEKQRKTLTTALSKTHPKVAIQEVVDPAVIGGVVLRIGSREIDASLRGKLQAIRKELETQL